MKLQVKRVVCNSARAFCFAVLGILLSVNCFAHFGMVIPSSDIVESPEDAAVGLTVMFAHPFEGETMNMEKPVEFGVYFEGKKKDLKSTLNPVRIKSYNDTQSYQAWRTSFDIKRPGDYIFYVEPAPYFEPAEDSFIVHYTKVIVNAFGKEEGWSDEIGLKAEIIPLTRPYGLYAGNVFQGQVKVKGKPVPFCEVEVEYYNEDGSVKAPRDAFITQVIRCDANGIFTYAFPRKGWWGFSALNEDEDTIKYEGKDKSVEIGAVMWVRVYDME